MPNILILSQWYFPDTWMQLRDLARRLADDGYGVEVLSAVPYSLTDGKIIPGYKLRLRQTEMLDGVKVVRLPLFISQSRSGLGRILCYTSFGLSAATLGQFGVKRPDIVFVYNLPTLGWAARLFKFFRGAKFVLMVQDLWPESVTNSGMLQSRLLNSCLNRWCRRFYRCADALTGLSPGFKENLVGRGVDPRRIEVVYNWTNEADPQSSVPNESNARFTVVYTGNMGIYQGIDTFIDAAEILAGRNVPADFRLIGGGVELDRLKQVAAAKNLPNLTFLPWVPSDEIGVELAHADALLLHLKRMELFKVTIPGKTQTYLRAGKPILCGIEGEAARLIETAKAGVVFEPENPRSLAEAVTRMAALPKEELTEMGRAGREFYKSQMAFEIGYGRITELFDRVLANRKGKR
ncbi:MAG: glycosyltransferase family 4 protein [Thermoguttaceae bacterium]|jgi:colanic acid biosynthesis glycosyl transferase WcaI